MTIQQGKIYDDNGSLQRTWIEDSGYGGIKPGDPGYQEAITAARYNANVAGKKSEVRKCGYCKKEFHAITRNQKFCGTICYSKHKSNKDKERRNGSSTNRGVRAPDN